MEQQKLWNLYAPVYDAFMQGNRKAYQEMYAHIRQAILGKEVLEIATGTGLIARHVAESSEHFTATDYADNMLRQAKRGSVPYNLDIQKEQAEALSFADNSFDVVIIANALHVMPHPEKALAEIDRVLKPGGLLIAPNFIHDTENKGAQAMSALLAKAGVAFEAKWDADSYTEFLAKNGWRVQRKAQLNAMIPLLYTECIRNTEIVRPEIVQTLTAAQDKPKETISIPTAIAAAFSVSAAAVNFSKLPDEKKRPLSLALTAASFACLLTAAYQREKKI